MRWSAGSRSAEDIQESCRTDGHRSLVWGCMALMGLSDRAYCSPHAAPDQVAGQRAAGEGAGSGGRWGVVP